jgi:hypothetical protein
VTFLSVYTPTYKRPFMLALCQASVQNQTVPVEHVIVRDKVGLGVGGMYGDIRNHAERVTGDYVMVLSDDNVLLDARFAEDLEYIVGEAERPSVVVFRGQTGPTLQPAAWCCEPIETMIDLSCFAVERETWQANAHRWGERYAGDFDFIHWLWASHLRFHWWDRIVFQALKISNGAAE